jgi:hypothetical protein
MAVTAILGILMLGTVAATFAYPVGLSAGSRPGSNISTSQCTVNTTTQTCTHDRDNESENQNNQGQDEAEEGGHFNLTVGTSITLSNLNGHWVAFSGEGNNHGGDDVKEEHPFSLKAGNTTGSFTFKVTGVSDEGANLTITSGSFAINGTTYAVSKGHLTLNEGLESGFGNGTASGGATFEIGVAGIHGNLSTAAQVGAIKLDVKTGTSGYLVILGTHEGFGEDDEED